MYTLQYNLKDQEGVNITNWIPMKYIICIRRKYYQSDSYKINKAWIVQTKFL